MTQSVTQNKTKRLNAKSVGLGGGLMVGIFTAAMLFSLAPQAKTQMTEMGPGCLTIHDKDQTVVRILPLEKTIVDADISGMAARVTVKQVFKNDSKTPIEAVYTFPLPGDAAVDQMNMKIGDRAIVGKIKRREEAQRIYQDAKNQGKVASLLDQERPNIFTQHVANIMPGAKIEIEISYVQVLPYENGQYSFVYPMVVGPRYLGGTPDPDKVSPPVMPPKVRPGHNVELNVKLDAGMKIEEIQSELHDVAINRPSDSRANVALKDKNEIPNRDFILKYRLAGEQVKSGLVHYADPNNGGFFMLVLMPPKAPDPEEIAPKEVFFVMDQSGSQSGFPIAKSRQLTMELIEALGPNDTFNVLGFSTTTNWLWPNPRLNSPENRAAAFQFVAGMQANGGTDLQRAVVEAYRPAADPERRRLVVFNTDGYVGNDFAVLDAVKKNRGNSRMFTFGIGNSVNRFLIDSMSVEGRGDSEIVLLSSEADKAVERFVARTERPVLLDVNVSFEGVQVADVLPMHIPDVFADKPIIIRGRYKAPGGQCKVRLSGLLGGKTPWSQTVTARLQPIADGRGDQLLDSVEASIEPNSTATGEVLQGVTIATLWARGMVDEVMRQNWLALENRKIEGNTQTKIESLGLRFGIMTQYTSFVAVEQTIVNKNGVPTRVEVPVAMPDGVDMNQAEKSADLSRLMLGSPPQGGGGYGGSGGGLGGASTQAPELNAPSKSASKRVNGYSGDFYVVGDVKLDTMTDEQIRDLSEQINSESELDVFKQLTPSQKVRYLRIARLDPKVRAQKTGTIKVSLYFVPNSSEMKAELSKAGMQLQVLKTELGMAEGTIKVDDLDRLAQVKGLKRVAMRRS